MYRHTSRKEGIEPVSEKRFREIIIPLEKRGVLVQRGGEHIERHLAEHGAEASNFGTDVMWFSENVSLSGVLEECYHFEQNLRHLNDEKDFVLRDLLNEIDAKEYLLRNADKYQIPRLETEVTKEQLRQYKKLLAEYERSEGDVQGRAGV